MHRRRSLVAVALIVAVIVVACGGDEDIPASAVLTAAPTQPSSTEPDPTPTTGPVGETTAPTTSSPTTVIPSVDDIAVPPTLEGLPLAVIRVSGEALVVAVADNGGARRQGLMNVEDLVDLDGMLFTWPDDTDGGFWMKDTLLPLDIAVFTADGSLVDTFPMEPCTESPCPTYFPAGAYRYALETEQGRLGDLEAETTLRFLEP